MHYQESTFLSSFINVAISNTHIVGDGKSWEQYSKNTCIFMTKYDFCVLRAVAALVTRRENFGVDLSAEKYNLYACILFISHRTCFNIVLNWKSEQFVDFQNLLPLRYSFFPYTYSNSQSFKCLHRDTTGCWRHCAYVGVKRLRQ